MEEKTVAELIFTIEVLTAEIEYAKSQIQPHDTGHIHTAIAWMIQRVTDLESEVRAIEYSLLSSTG